MKSPTSAADYLYACLFIALCGGIILLIT